MSDNELSHKQEVFCLNYIRYGNAALAAKACGTPAKNARQGGYKLLQNSQVAARIKQLQMEFCQKIQVEAEKVMQELARIAFHDYTLISQIRHVSCEKCWINYAQRARLEYAEDMELAELSGEHCELPDRLEVPPETPDPDCRTCYGRGKCTIWHADSRDLGPCEKAAVKYVSMGKYGIRIHVADKLHALELLAKHLGLFDRPKSKNDEHVTIMVNGVKLPPPHSEAPKR